MIYRESSTIDHLGNTLNCGADINDDGYEDCAVSAYWESLYAPRGGVYIMQGSSDGLPSYAQANARIYGDTEYGYAGIAISYIENFSAQEGTAIAIGAYGDKRIPTSEDTQGAVHIFLQPPQGSLLLSDAEVHIYGEGGAFGYHVAGLDDFDGDTRGDLLVGAYMYEGGTSFIFSGGE